MVGWLCWQRKERFRRTLYTLETQLVAQQKRVPLNVDFADPPAAYQLFNLTGGTKLNLWKSNKKLYLNLGLNNLFNKTYRDYLSRYRYFTDDPGLNFISRITFKF